MSIEGNQNSDVTPEALLTAAQNAINPEGATEQTPEALAPKEEPKPEVDKFAPKFAALSRQEKALKQRERALAAREAAFTAKEKPAEAAPAPKEPIEQRLLKDTFGTLKELGLTPETLVQMMLNDGKATPELQMQILKQELSRASGDKISSVEKELQDMRAERQKEREEREQVEQNKLIGGFKSQIKDFIKTDLDKYELLSIEEDYGIDLIYDKIAQDAQAKQEEQGEEFDPDTIMSIEEAASQIEEQLLDAAKKRIGAKKIKSLTGTPSAPAQSTKPQAKASTTLSNGQAQVQGQVKAAQSDKDRLAAAIALISAKP